MKRAAILLAGGKSSRFGGESKCNADMGGVTVLEYTFRSLEKSKLFDEIVVVEDGGNTRQESSFLGLTRCNSPDYVLIHDAVRPFVSVELLTRNLELVKKHKAVNTCIPIYDTLNYVVKNSIVSTPNRSFYQLGQTPQTFEYELILKAHKSTEQTNASDDCSLVRELGCPVYTTQGSIENFKITTQEDFDLLKLIYHAKHKISGGMH